VEIGIFVIIFFWTYGVSSPQIHTVNLHLPLNLGGYFVL